jgi:transcriptional regulator with XRE-family HTH domain
VIHTSDEIELRREVAKILGTPAQRRKLRRSLGLSLDDVSRMTGLSRSTIARRESSDWRGLRESLTSPSGLEYIRLHARMKGIDLNRTTEEGNGRASPRAAA